METAEGLRWSGQVNVVQLLRRSRSMETTRASPLAGYQARVQLLRRKPEHGDLESEEGRLYFVAGSVAPA